MNRLILLLLAAVCPLATARLACAADAAAEVKPLPEPQTAAQDWLKLVDEGKHAEAWTTAASDFKKTVNQKKWLAAVRDMRAPKGKLTSRKLASSEPAKDLPGAPEGDYVILRYDSAFEKKPSATETVTVFRGPDLKWRVSAYTIK